MKIKESYKMYWKLKTRALEETLMDITFNDETHDSVSNQDLIDTPVKESERDAKPLRDETKQVIEIPHERDKAGPENTKQKDIESADKKAVDDISKENIESTDKKDSENIDPEGCKGQSPITSTSVDENEYKNVKGVWGDHLSKANEQIPKKKQPLFLGRSSSFQLSQNKFANSSFTKRNPRKSLSMSKIKSKSDNDNARTDKLEQTANSEANGKNGVDDGSAETKPMFGDAVKVTYAESKSNTQSLATVQQIIEGHTINRNLNSGWLNRCAKQNNLEYPKIDPQRLSGTSDSGIESTLESSIHSPKENVPAPEVPVAPQISDDEDFVCNSDSEEEHKNKRIRNFKKRCSDQDNHPAKRLCTATDANLSIANRIERQSENINTVSSEEKCENFNSTGITAVRSSSVNIDRHIETNSSSGIDKCDSKPVGMPQIVDENIHDEKDPEKSPEQRTATSRKVRRRIKKVPSNDSDPDFDEGEEEKNDSKKAPTTKRARTTRKNKSSNKTATKGEKKNESKVRKSSRKKKDSQHNEENTEAAEGKEPVIYGIETLEAVPRFAVSKCAQGDLIEQYTRSVSSKTDTLKTSVVTASTKGALSDREKLEKKVADGKVNENFVRINLKKKVFVRGKKNFNFSKYKKNQWKQRKKELGSGEGSLAVADFVEKIGGSSKCFKCGEMGHFSRRCPNSKDDDLIPLNEVDNSSPFPTLEEAQEMASKNAVMAHGNRIAHLPEKPSYCPETGVELPENKMDDNNADDNDLWEAFDDEVI